MDLIHHISRGDRKFVLMNNENEMRGFLLEMKRVHPSMVRNESMISVEGVDRFIADTIYIPEERRGLYLNEAQALKFSNGRIIKDKIQSEGLSSD